MKAEAIHLAQSRRRFLQDFAGGLGTVGLWHLLASDGFASEINAFIPRKPHFEPKAKNVIFIFIEGGPSQIDLFDPKPEMKKWDGQSLPESMTKDLKLAFIKPTAQIWASPRPFKRYGQCGMDFSDWLPHLANCADDICMIRSVATDQFNHSRANSC